METEISQLCQYNRFGQYTVLLYLVTYSVVFCTRVDRTMTLSQVENVAPQFKLIDYFEQSFRFRGR